MRGRLRVVLGLPLALGLTILGGCASLPPRPTTATEQIALPIASDTALDEAIAPLAAAHPGESGFRLVSDGVEAFALRGLSARYAERSLDVQYYIWHDDLTGWMLARELVRAADRGVRVRLLLDDMDARAHNFALAGLDAHPDIEVRLFNPVRLPTRHGQQAARRDDRVLAHQPSHAQQDLDRRQPHRHHRRAQRRRRVLRGQRAGELRRYRLCRGRSGGRAAQRCLRPLLEFDGGVPGRGAEPGPGHAADTGEAARRRCRPLGAKSRESAWAQSLADNAAVKRIQSGELDVHWTPRWQVLADDPLKAMKAPDPKARSEVLRGFGQAMRDSKSTITLISPYFVPGDAGTASLVDAVTDGRRVQIITNSLAANDVAAVHGGYSKYRERLVDGGVSLWELKPTSGPGADKSLFGSSGASLHTKAAIMDAQTVFVGSFNLDPRSVSLNCEQGVLATHPALAAQLEAQFQRMISGASAWKVELDAGGKLQWSDGKQTRHKEPEASFWRKAQAWLTRLLPFESQL